MRFAPVSEGSECCRAVLGDLPWTLGTVPLEWQSGIVLPRGCTPTIEGSYFSASLGRSTPGRAGEESSTNGPTSDTGGTMWSYPGHGILDQLYWLVLVGLRVWCGWFLDTDHSIIVFLESWSLVCISGQTCQTCS